MPILLPPWSHPLFGLAALLLGACIGSFLNVAIYRLPRGMSVNEPKRSFCPICKKGIPMWRNIPVITWILQRGKCAECSAPIAARYVIVEILTALVWLACWYLFPNPIESVFFMLLSSVFIVIWAVDAELMVIPRQLTIFGTALGFLMAAVHPGFLGEETWTLGLLKSVLGFALGWCGLWAIVLLGKLAFGKYKVAFDEVVDWNLEEPKNDEEELCFAMNGESLGWSEMFYRKNDKLILQGVEEVTIDGETRAASELIIQEDSVLVDGEEHSIEGLKSLSGRATGATVPREAMGMGDVDLLGMLGACLGASSLLFTIFAACIVSILWAMVARLGFGKQMPFGPSIIVGAILWVFVGEELWNAYLAAMGV